MHISDNSALALVASVLLLGGSGAQAQTLASRVAAVGTGTVRLEYASQPGVCGNGRGNISIRRGDGTSTFTGTYSRGSRNEWEDECEPGPVRVALDVERGTVTALRAYVGGRWRGDADLELGAVPAAEASRFLVEIAARGASRPAKDAIFPAMLADAPSPWPALLAIAKDDNRPRDVRSSALFWVGQVVEDEATKGLEEIVDADGDREVRKSAVFSLSQRHRDESIPALIRIARTNRDREIRKSAIFWLAQSRDDRAIRYFEEVLLGAR
ncbi:MAG: HEAT repeat domain-containing protein [Gemmatimonadaceae bacterium]